MVCFSGIWKVEIKRNPFCNLLLFSFIIRVGSDSMKDGVSCLHLLSSRNQLLVGLHDGMLLLVDIQSMEIIHSVLAQRDVLLKIIYSEVSIECIV